MKIKSEESKVGDTLKTIWAGRTSTIKCFHEYNGPFDFVLKIAEFYDGTRMSLEKDHYYDCVD